MTQLIEDYALIGNNATTALVGRNGSIDWLGFPRFDSAACMAALLGTSENGRWTISPKAEHPGVKRRYRQGTLVLETEFSTTQGTVLLIDCMARHGGSQDVVRIVRGLSGCVDMQMELALRFDYGTVVPWVSRIPDGRLQGSFIPCDMPAHPRFFEDSYWQGVRNQSFFLLWPKKKTEGSGFYRRNNKFIAT